MADNTAVLKISADVAAAKAALLEIQNHVKDVSNEVKKMSSESKSSLAAFKQDWVLATASVAAFIVTLQKAWNIAEKAAEFEEMEAGLQGLAAKYDMTAESAIAMAKEAVDGQLSMMEAGKLAAKAFALGFDPSQVKEFLVTAEKLSDVMGGSIPASAVAWRFRTSSQSR
jgi:hypothetical protein